jgi:hypothetical protein
MSTINDPNAKPIVPDLDHYDGKWVAVRDRQVVAHADDEATLMADPAVANGDCDCFPIGPPAAGFYMINV